MKRLYRNLLRCIFPRYWRLKFLYPSLGMKYAVNSNFLQEVNIED